MTNIAYVLGGISGLQTAQATREATERVAEQAIKDDQRHKDEAEELRLLRELEAVTRDPEALVKDEARILAALDRHRENR